MKSSIILLSACILFSSCYSYKYVDLTSHNILFNKKYRIATKESKKIKAEIYKINDNTITIIKKEIKWDAIASFP